MEHTVIIPPWTPDDPWPNDAHDMLLIGPPGTGKTRTILEHYAIPAIRRGEAVLVTSYTVAAASVLRDRAADALDTETRSLRRNFATIHSEAWDRIKVWCKTQGLDVKRDTPKRDDEDEDETISAAAERETKSHNEREHGDPLKAWQETRCRWPEDRGLPIRERLARILYGAWLDAAEAVVTAYETEKRKDRLIDYTDCLEIALTNDARQRNLDLLAGDEVQDLCPLQWALIEKWSTTSRRILVVGDPDQSVYGWSGADGRRIFQRVDDSDLPGMPARRLAQSWRVPQATHAIARRIVQQIHARRDAPYEPAMRAGDAWATTAEAAAEYAARAALAPPDGHHEGTPVVLWLSRTNRGAREATEMLDRMGIPCTPEKSAGLFLRTGQMATASLLYDAARGAETLRVDWLRLLKGLTWQTLGPRGEKSRVLSALEDESTPEILTNETAEALGVPVAVLVARWTARDWPWWASAVLGSKIPLDDLAALHGALERHGRALPDLVSRIVTTNIHASKGREAPVVVLDARRRSAVGMSTPGRLPMASREDRLDEELRLAYVAVTRAAQTLLVVHGDDPRGSWLHQIGAEVELPLR